MVKAAVKSYSNHVIMEGVLNDSSDQLLKEAVELCQVQAKEDLEVLCLGDRLSELFWRFEQQWHGEVNGKKVQSPIDFEGAKPYILIAWKLVH
ncbi:hypothetical protein NST41_14310 [Paenibacillus sp. FSL L8-0696]|uniref:hypothetical protein n=1 Tax=Paenibacillus sp. FSL L8-0696 TaxID=2954524 RepID=UPI003119A4F9